MADFTTTFLGTGTSMGVPMIGCDCQVCRSPDPRDRRTRSSVYIETPEAAFVIDTGVDFRAQALREKIARLDAVIFTHSHTDHIMGLDDLRPFCFGDRTLEVFASAATLADLRRVYEFVFSGKNLYPGYLRLRAHEVHAPFAIGQTAIAPLPVPHGRSTTLGYLFSREGRPLFAYLSDCHAVPPEIVEEVRGVDTLVLDTLRHQPHPTHLSVSQACAIAAEIQPRATYLTHISHELGHAATEAGLPENVRLAYDGLILKWGAAA